MLTAILLVAMFLVAVVFSMLGQGGGVLYTPIQVWAGIDFHVAATTSLFLIMVMSFSSSIVFRKAKRIDWPLALALESATVAGGFAGGLWSARFSGAFLTVMFAAVVAFAAVFMIRSFQPPPDCGEGAGGLLAWRRQVGQRVYCVNMGLGLPVSFAAGLVSGMVGVGGGILKVPVMVLALGVPIEIAVGSSAFMVGLTAAGGFAGHLMRGHWDWRTSLALAAAVFLGAQLGSRISVGLDKNKLKRGFGWFLLAVAVLMVVRGLFHAPTPR